MRIIDGKVGIGTTNPTARLHLAVGTSAAGTAPLKFTSGTAMTNPEDGAMEYDGGHLYFTIGSTRYQLDQQSGGSLPSGTEGQMMYNNAGSWTAFSGMIWNDTNNFLGIGAATPLAKFHSGMDISDYSTYSFANTGAVITSIGVDQDDARSNALTLMRDGTSGVVYAGAAAFDLSQWESSSTNTRMQMDIRLSHSDTNTLTDVMSLRSSGNVGISNTAPTARLHLAAGTATAGTAPLKLTSGTALGTPEDGAMEYHSSHLYFTIGSTRYQLDQQSAGSSTLQGAYDATSGNTITTTTGRNVIFTLAELATATSVTIENQDTAGDSAEKITNSIASGTLTNGLLFEQTGAGTVTNAISILETAGTVSTAINIGNNVGTGISIGTGLTTGISVGSGGITIASGTAYTGSGTVTLSSGSASGLTIDSGTTGAIDIGTGANAKTITVGNSTGATAVNINAGTGGINFEAAGTGTTDSIQVGAGGAGSETPDLLGLDVKSNTGNPAGFEGAMYYNTSDNKFRCYQKDRWRDCIDYTTPYAPYYVSGEYYNQAVNGLAKTTIAGAANRMDISPFAPQVDFTVASFAIDVTTSVASSNVRIVVYASNETTKLPSDRLLQSGDLSGATTGMKTYTPGSAFTFEAGKYYWVGVHHSSTATLRGINVGALAPLGTPSAAGTTQNTILRRSSVTYGTSSPDPFGTGTSTSAIMPEIKMLAN
jgi:hypothetical protein